MSGNKKWQLYIFLQRYVKDHTKISYISYDYKRFFIANKHFLFQLFVFPTKLSFLQQKLSFLQQNIFRSPIFYGRVPHLLAEQGLS
jgi:hypothetical protein